MIVALDARVKRWLRFLLGGMVNTAFSYAVFLSLTTILAYQLAYFIAYSMGVVFAYLFNALWVFRVPLSWKGLFSYPIVYVIQYLLSALLLGALVEVFGVSVNLAPIFVIIALFPIAYLMSRFVLTPDAKKNRMGT